ncbi:hypothetical protein JHE00_29645 [Prauserella sp. ASG 168]|uniref:PE domain-containing protein n=1 Tax=Prauserella cavernicola TaxID=2800127 RepID=A0A934R0B4_9PSEU|nr:hypothetical protein [Prauserella cavernicola]
MDTAAAQAAMSVMPGGAAVGGALATFNNMNFIVDGKSSSGPGAGGGFSMSREEAEAALEEARGVAADLAEQAEGAMELQQTQAPADDPATMGFNQVGLEAFGNGAQHVAAERDYWRSLVTALEKALGVYQEADEQAGQDIGKSGRQKDSGGGLI